MNPESLTVEQKEYFAGVLAGMAARAGFPAATSNAAPETAEEKVFGVPRSELCKQELWKLEEDSLEIWEKLLAHAAENQMPNEENTFRFRYHGLFNVSPAQNSLMLRCRIPAGELTSAQMLCLAYIAEHYGGGYADVTTRSNIQIREIAPKNIINTLLKLQEAGLTSRGSGVDNIRNITASPTAGFDPAELIDTRPFAKDLHYYILNQRDLYGLPRKFNVAFEGGGAVSAVADSNDIGFIAARVGQNQSVPPGVYFRVELAGISGHKQMATDSGILVQPEQSVRVAVAMIRVFKENGCRTDRKKARLKYLIDDWGMEKFLAETEKKLSFPLLRFPLQNCISRSTPLKHGHLGVYRQRQRGLNYVGLLLPVGRLQVTQMRRLAEIAQNYGAGELRLTPWQNVIIPHIPDAVVEIVKRNILRIGLNFQAGTIAGGLVACTGNAGCKYASTNTKTDALNIGRYLESKVSLKQPINIHVTGCPHSCAQHYIGDIGLIGVKTMLNGATVDGYNIVFGGGDGPHKSIGKEVFKGIPASAVTSLLETVLVRYQKNCHPGESFGEFTRRHEVKRLQEMFSE